VVRHSEMEYLAPISDEFQARCDSPGAEAWGRFGPSLHRRGKAQITLTVLVTSGGAQTGSSPARTWRFGFQRRHDGRHSHRGGPSCFTTVRG
jgi:hypothetical protein